MTWKLCKVCAFKILTEEEICPNCQQRSLVKTSDPSLPKRIDLLKDEPTEEDV